MQIINDKALLLRVRDPGRITTIIHKSRQLESGEVLVRWGLEEAMVLKNLGVKNVPSPIKTKYTWPGVHKPFAHQIETASFLTMHRRAFCFGEQGTGKTPSTIWAADYLMDEGFVKRVLVLCPLSIMQSAWEADLFKVAMHRSVAIAHSSVRDKRVAAIQSGAEFVIINYDGLEIVKEEAAAAAFDLIVVDECNHYKNIATKRWKTLKSLLKPDTWVWMLTGTPAAHSPLDAHGLARIINPGAVPPYLGAFRDLVMHKITQFKWVPKPSATHIVHEVLQPAIRYTKEECLDLPDMLYTTREVPLSAQQKKYYELLKRDMTAIAAGEEITAVNAAVILNKLLQLVCGAVYSDTKEVIEFDAKGRMAALLETIEEASHKVIVFAPFRHAIDIIAEFLRARGITTEVIHGAVSATKRTEIFTAFQNTPNPHVLVIQPQAAAHGVTLHAANVVVWWGPIMSTETYLQANARVHRAGQRNPCTVVHLTGSPVERRLYTMLSQKIDVHSRLVELYKNLAQDS